MCLVSFLSGFITVLDLDKIIEIFDNMRVGLNFNQRNGYVKHRG